MRSENIKLNKNKCKIFITEIIFLGHKFTSDSLEIDVVKLKQ